ncbi:expressed unknown protein [Seminavis robusta]|uniref:Uncharacterized protein n=1 Tax=Seminavis robusta TaxID=568900 RepID=A0A9N8HA05_9STRA|nr:expressed unknown protein [Seminavis robusta]|eukprot:Sro225_g091770.1 n/a (154) ;mRNA; f:33536-33997
MFRRAQSHDCFVVPEKLDRLKQRKRAIARRARTCAAFDRPQSQSLDRNLPGKNLRWESTSSTNKKKEDKAPRCACLRRDDHDSTEESCPSRKPTVSRWDSIAKDQPVGSGVTLRRTNSSSPTLKNRVPRKVSRKGGPPKLPTKQNSIEMARAG